MHDSYLLLLLVLSSNTVNSSVFSDLKENVRSLLDTSREKSQDSSKRGLNDYIQEKNQNNGKVWENSAQKDNAQKKIRGDISPSKMTATTTSKNTGRSFFRVDPVFDSLKHRRLWQNPKFKKAISSSSSAIEMRFWLEDWEEQKEDKKFKALNSSQPLTDVVNMKMASKYTIHTTLYNFHLNNKIYPFKNKKTSKSIYLFKCYGATEFNPTHTFWSGIKKF